MSAAAVLWFRKSLRVHDSPALALALQSGRDSLCPVFFIDPHFVGRVGALRYNFLVETLCSLDAELKRLGSALVLMEGSPSQCVAQLAELGMSALVFEKDSEPYAKARDAQITRLCDEKQVDVQSVSGHTLWDLDHLVDRCPGRKMPKSYGAFEKLVASIGEPKRPIDAPDRLPPLPAWGRELCDRNPSAEWRRKYCKPLAADQALRLTGGEKAALEKMRRYCGHAARVSTFEKPKTDPTKAWFAADDKLEDGATTVLSPYLHFGSLSPRTFYWELRAAEIKAKQYSKPPVSLIGQLLWREYFHLAGYVTPNFDRIEGNPLCRQIPWKENTELFEAWRDGRTGFPWIDAIMRQLRREGWMHHLARHCVACFLTRGDLYQSWEKGVQVFDELLLDADWSLNNANWMWLSASAFFSQYWKVYSPIAFGKKYDKEGAYIKKFVPELRRYPAKYIYEPWKASKAEQKMWGCIIGVDYPAPICDHNDASTACKEAMKKAYAKSAGDDGDGDEADM